MSCVSDLKKSLIQIQKVRYFFIDIFVKLNVPKLKISVKISIYLIKLQQEG